jgi:trk system potassium uptake protein TrkH
MVAWTLRKLSRLHPATLLLLSYLLAIVIGTGLLLLPFATVSHRIDLIDAVFTATSAVCVTGLIVVDTGSYFSLFGQLVILLLIQLGGLGIMTVTVMLFQVIGKRVFFQQRMALQEVFSHTPRADIYQLLRSIFIFTALVEILGTILLFFHWLPDHPPSKALLLSAFHAISAFCNAGFSLFATSFMTERASLPLNAVICTLIILGGLGFPVVYELYRRRRQPDAEQKRLSVQAKTVLATSGLLILGGALILFLSEMGSQEAMGKGERLLVSIFQSVTCRTAGFNTVNMVTLNSASLVLILLLMFFGASPGSCGGGVKTTSLAVLAAFSVSRLKRHARVNMFKHSIPSDTVSKCISMLLLSVGIIFCALFLILFFDPAHGGAIGGRRKFLSYLFEVVSAFGTVGLSMGITPALNAFGKGILIVVMIIGRVGIPVFTYLIAGPSAAGGIEYAEENIMIG